MNKNIDFGTVADLYDVYVQWDADVPFFREVCAGVTSEVLELMCGTGRLSIPLLEAGARLCCVDYSAEMLEVFRRKLRVHGHREATLRVWITARYTPDSGLGEALQEYEILGKDGRLLERRELPMRFAVTDRATFESEAAAAGFRVLRLWGDYSGGRFEPEQSPYMIWELGIG